MLGVVREAPYIGSIVTNNLSLEPELSKCMGRIAVIHCSGLKGGCGRLTANWPITAKCMPTKPVSSALSVVALNPGLCTPKERRDSTFYALYMRCLRRILGIKDRVPNIQVFDQTAIPSSYTLSRFALFPSRLFPPLRLLLFRLRQRANCPLI